MSSPHETTPRVSDAVRRRPEMRRSSLPRTGAPLFPAAAGMPAGRFGRRLAQPFPRPRLAWALVV